jgi:N-acetyl sugar amidotransferase
MDSSFSKIKFDINGKCDCCKDAISRKNQEWFPGKSGQSKIKSMLLEIQKSKQGRYDAIIGLSGGIDSAYLAHLAVKTFKLKVLAVHVDGGWNSFAAVKNIASIVKKLKIDLITEVIDWSEMRDIQKSFILSSVLNQDIPQDHAFFSMLYKSTRKYKVKFFLSGVNFTTESISPKYQSPSYMDSKHIKNIHSRFGESKIKKFPFMSLGEFILRSRVLGQIKVFKPLNYINYNKDEAVSLLKKNYGWIDYGGKHNESRFTKFYQDIYLFDKFNIDKRRIHLSSLIVSEQLKREDALKVVTEKPIDEANSTKQLKFISKKLEMPITDLRRALINPPIAHTFYKTSNYRFIYLLAELRSWIPYGKK